jgi:hypothetical protein
VPPWGAGRSLHEVCEWDVQDVGDSQESAQLHLSASLNVLDRAAVEPGGLPDLVLGEALASALGANAVAYGPASLGNPVVIVGQVSHPSHGGMIKVSCLRTAISFLRS